MSRDESLFVDEKKDGWIAYDGQGQPVDDEVIVEYKVLNKSTGDIQTYGPHSAVNIFWKEDGSKWSLIAYRIVEEPKKKYKLSEMYRVWYRGAWPDSIISDGRYFFSIEDALRHTENNSGALAITRADATEFYEDEGFDLTGGKID